MKNKLYLYLLSCCLLLNTNLFATSSKHNSAELLTKTTTTALLNDTLLSLEQDTLLFYLEDCAGTASLCIDILLSEISNFQITDNGNPYAAGIAPCNFDTINSYTYTTLFGLGNAGPYFLEEWEVEQPDTTIIFSGEFQNILNLVDSMNVWDSMGNWVLDSLTLNITGGNPVNKYTVMSVTVINIQTPSMIGYSQGFNPKGTELNFGLGRHELIVLETATGCADTILVNVACVNPETIYELQRVGETDTFCITDFSELLASPNSVTNTCNTSTTFVDFQILADTTCISFTGISPGLDTACIVVCDGFGVCDTTYLIVQVTELAGTHNYLDTVDIGALKIHCIDTTVLSGEILSMENICVEASNGFVDFNLDTLNNCVSYMGINIGGPDTACIVICNAMNLCDTSYFYIWAEEMGSKIIHETILLNATNSYCPDTTQLAGNIVSIINDCADSSGEYLSFEVDTINYCLNYTAIDVGIDSACILIMDDLGNIDTTYLIVKVETPHPSYILDTLTLEETATYCLDTSELYGTIDTIYDLCNNFAGTAVNFTVDFVSLCIEVESMNLGLDTACIVFCDNYSVCDTVYLSLSVMNLDSANPPIARNDSDTTVQNIPVSINICRNDDIPDNILSLGPLVIQGTASIGPNYGSTIENSDCTIMYIPTTNECDIIDSFQYVICNEIACDTALARVYIECETTISTDFEIYSAFSPNGDKVNDVFVIKGIEAFPNHNLIIYNRWGNQILNTTDYKNDWRGLWEGRDLPDGTYFYAFDRGDGNSFSGYIFIHR